MCGSLEEEAALANAASFGYHCTVLFMAQGQRSVPSGQVFGISGCMVMDILLAVNTVIQCKHSDIKVSSEDMPVKCDDVDDVSCKSRIDAIRAWSFRSMTIVSI